MRRRFVLGVVAIVIVFGASVGVILSVTDDAPGPVSSAPGRPPDPSAPAPVPGPGSRSNGAAAQADPRPDLHGGSTTGDTARGEGSGRPDPSAAGPDDEGARLRLLWVALALAPLVQAAAALLILPLYGRRRRARAALAVAAVGAIPLYTAGLSLVLLPGIIVVLVAFFVSLVWWITGTRQLLEVPQGEATEFVTITVLAASSALFLCSAALPS